MVGRLGIDGRWFVAQPVVMNSSKCTHVCVSVCLRTQHAMNFLSPWEVD